MRTDRRLAFVLVAFGIAGPAQAYVLFSEDWTWSSAPMGEDLLTNVGSFPASVGPESLVRDALLDAMDAWNDEGGAVVEVTWGGDTEDTSWSNDGQNVLQWQAGASSLGDYLAVAQYWSSGANIEDCDVQFYEEDWSGTITWSADPEGPAYDEMDLQTVAEHEIGHCLGLDHSADTDAIMYPTIDWGIDVEERALSADDISGVQAIYGVDCDDLDGDGVGRASSCGGDCDDGDATVYPGATESCDGIDEDCDDLVDETFDADADGYASCDGDCDDTDADVNPGELEACDGVDNDCDGAYLSGEQTDGDGDGLLTCEDCSEGADADGDGVPACSDCDDGDASAHTGATEVCDGVDNDCDGLVDNEAATTATFGDASSSVARTGYVYGNVYRPDRDLVLQTFAMYLTPATAVSATWFVLESIDDGGPYEQVASSTATLTTGAGWKSAGDLDVTLDEDRYYVLGVATSGASVSFSRTASPSFAAASDLTPEGYLWYSGTAAPTPWSQSPSTNYLFYQQVEVGPLPDVDGDGVTELCDDCDDTERALYPGADETCDGTDEDCDGTTDEDATDADTWYRDADGDGYGDPAATVEDCSAPTGYVENASDCDDADAAISPDADELCNGTDDDCDGALSTGEDADADGDGWLACEDCDDTESLAWDGAEDGCDGIDNDCDGYVDNEPAETATFGSPEVSQSRSGVFVGNVYRADVTQTLRSFGHYLNVGSGATGTFYVMEGTSASGPFTTAWSSAVTYADNTGYVDSGTVDVTLEAGNYYLVGASFSTAVWWRDSTPSFTSASDLTPQGYVFYGAVAVPEGLVYAPSTVSLITQELEVAPLLDADGDGWTLICEDCDDDDAGAFPGNTELCDGLDEDCDGVADDDAADAPTWYLDADGDAYGDAVSEVACAAPSGYVAVDGDCDDTRADLSPAAVEACDGVDEDCDGTVDDDASDAATWHADADADGFGDGTASLAACDQPVGYGSDAADCDDSDPSRFPGASEVCDGLDQDCDGTADEGALDASTWHADTDADGYGNPDATVDACDAPTGYVADDSDCDDGAAGTWPGAPEVCDGADQDCDAVVDDDAVDVGSWYEDADGDGFGAGAGMTGCFPGAGWSANPSDCDDTRGDTSPDGVEVWYDGIDQDCDGTDDDQDGDGHLLADDCDDTDAAVNRGETEVWYDGIDQNCDGSDDDQDGDGHMLADDCDDLDATVNSGETEVWYDGIDQNCDGNDDDQDGDGFAMAADCDDLDATVYPGSPGVGLDCTLDSGSDTGQPDTGGMDSGHSDTDTAESTDTAEPGDTDTSADTDTDTADEPMGETHDSGAPLAVNDCGCASGQPSASFLTLAMALLPMLRRRASTPC